MNNQHNLEVVTSNDLFNLNYWQTKFAVLKLSAAIHSYQPQGAIQHLIRQIIEGCDKILLHIDHEMVKLWHRQAVDAQKKIGGNANATIFRHNFAWDDHAFEAGWTHYHMAITAAFDGNASAASHHAQQALAQLKEAQNRMLHWPENIRHWINSALLTLPTFTLIQAA
jgi:hypothetical protein